MSHKVIQREQCYMKQVEREMFVGENGMQRILLVLMDKLSRTSDIVIGSARATVIVTLPLTTLTAIQWARKYSESCVI